MNEIEQEKAILGGVMMDSGAHAVAVQAGMSADTFALDIHRALWLLISDLAEQGDPIDTMTVCRSAQQLGADLYGGLAYVSSLPDQCPSVETLGWLCKQATNASRKRDARRRLEDAVRFLDDGGSVDDVIADVTAALDTVAAGEGDNLVGGADLAEMLWHSVTTDDDGPMKLNDRELDECFGPVLYRGRFSVLGARPGAGKTAVALNIALILANQGHGVCFLSMEQPAHQVALRLCAIDGAAPLGVLLNKPRGLDPKAHFGRHWGDVVEFNQHLSTLPIYIDDKPAQTLGYIRSRLVRLAAAMRAQGQELRFVVLDYIQRASLPKAENNSIAIGLLCKGLADLARELDVSMLALSQLNRQIEGRSAAGAAIRLDDFKGSGTIEDSADWMGGVWRPGRRAPGRDDDTMQLNVCKSRHGADGGRHDFEWRGQYLQVRGK